MPPIIRVLETSFPPRGGCIKDTFLDKTEIERKTLILSQFVENQMTCSTQFQFCLERYRVYLFNCSWERWESRNWKRSDMLMFQGRGILFNSARGRCYLQQRNLHKHRNYFQHTPISPPLLIRHMWPHSSQDRIPMPRTSAPFLAKQLSKTCSKASGRIGVTFRRSFSSSTKMTSPSARSWTSASWQPVHRIFDILTKMAISVACFLPPFR